MNKFEANNSRSCPLDCIISNTVHLTSISTGIKVWDSCDAGAVDPEWAAKVQQGNIFVMNLRNGNDGGNFTCTVQDSTPKDLGGTKYKVPVACEYAVTLT